MTHHAQLVFVCVHVCAGTRVCLGVCGGQKTTFVVVLQLFSTLFCFGFCYFFPFFFFKDKISHWLYSVTIPCHHQYCDAVGPLPTYTAVAIGNLNSMKSMFPLEAEQGLLVSL